MARIVDQSSEIDPALQEALQGGRAVRSGGQRDGNVRSASRQKRDKFYIPPDMIPKGYVVEWQRKSCLGREEEADHFMDLEDAGWKFAPVEQFKRLMPNGYEGKTVERGGLILMMRPKHLHDADQKLRNEEAVAQVRDKLTEIGMTGQGEMKRVVSNFNRSYERPVGIEAPDDSGD